MCASTTSWGCFISFVGRTVELEKLNNWLKSGRPCIAITGVGGIGKTLLTREFISRKKDSYDADATYLSLKGEEDEIYPVRIVMEGVGKGFGRKVAEWLERRWNEIEEFSCGIVGAKKEVKEKAEKSLKEILSEADSRLAKKGIVVLDDLQVVDEESLRFFCELATVSWENLRWILVHRDWTEISRGLKGLSGWSHLKIKGLNADDIAQLFLHHAARVIGVKEIDKKALHRATNGYPNWIEAIVHALGEEFNGSEVRVTERFIKENYNIFTKPIEHILNNYLDDEERTVALCIAIFKEEATIGACSSTLELTPDILDSALKRLEMKGKGKEISKLKGFNLITFKHGEFKIHDEKRDRIVDVIDHVNEEHVKKARLAVLATHLDAAHQNHNSQNYTQASHALVHSYHHAHALSDLESALEFAVRASADFEASGEIHLAYICSKHVLEKLRLLPKQGGPLINSLKLRAISTQSQTLFSHGLDSIFEYNVSQIFDDASKAFLAHPYKKKERKNVLEAYSDMIVSIMHYFSNKRQAQEILDLLKKAPLKGEEMEYLKIRASEALVFLGDSRAEELLKETETAKGTNSAARAYVKGLSKIEVLDFSGASKSFRKAAIGFSRDYRMKGNAVFSYCLAAILTADKTRTLEMLAEAEKNLVSDISMKLAYEFTKTFFCAKREEGIGHFVEALSRIPMSKSDMERYQSKYFPAFPLLGYLEGSTSDEDIKEWIEKSPLYRVICSMNNKEDALKALDSVTTVPLLKNAFKKGIIQEPRKMAKLIAILILFT